MVDLKFYIYNYQGLQGGVRVQYISHGRNKPEKMWSLKIKEQI